jgi:ribosomal protein L16 Arg81 hydroxylase
MTEEGMEAPVLGFTPHYKDTGNLETQTKVHAAYNQVSMASAYEKQKLACRSTIVELHAGDILYHPAGIWHAVESTSDDSFSINFSLR